MFHDRFDLSKWAAEYPLSRLRDEGRRWVIQRRESEPQLYTNQKQIDDHIALMQPAGEIIVEPKDLAIVEQLRAEARKTGAPTDGVLTDVFVFYDGEPSRRDVTKVGGIPYWPKNQPWPLGGAGKSLGFLTQLCFCDSRDLFPGLPGDVLTIFADLERINSYEIELDVLNFYWWPLGIDELVSTEDVPACVGVDILGDAREFKVKPYHVELHRTEDYPGGWQALDGYRCSWNLREIEGTKIGGTPRWVQSPEELPGNFLAALGGCNELAWGDMGSVYLSLDEDGIVHWTHQCY